jgi:hypothetical protein
VMLFLVLNIANDRVELGMPIREGAIALLPTELAADPLVLVYIIRRITLDIPHQVRKRHRRFQTYQNGECGPPFH